MSSRLFCLQRLLKYSLTDTVFIVETISSFANFSTIGTGESKKSLITIVKSEVSIANDEGIDKINGKESTKTEKRRRNTVNLVTPSLDDSRRKELQTVVGLHLGYSSVYCAKVHRCGEVLDWTKKELFPIAEMAKKVQLPKLCEEIYSLVEQLPIGDVYVLEGTRQVQVNSLQSSTPSVSAIAILRAQIYAMLVALLNTRVEPEDSHLGIQQELSEDLEYFHKVFLLRPRLMSRLFHLLIGTERVSALVLVDSILDGTNNSSKLTISQVMNETKTSEEIVRQSDSAPSNSYSPPVFTPVTVPFSIKESYRCLRAVEKEGMCQALLIAMAFYDLVVFKDPKVLAPLQL